MGDRVPRMLELLSDPATWDEGMELYWRLAPVRRAGLRGRVRCRRADPLVPRAVWKYQGWLMGFNGGPLRGPHQRITAAQMAKLRAGATAAGLPVTAMGTSSSGSAGTRPAMRLVDGSDVDALATSASSGSPRRAARRSSSATAAITTGRVQVGDDNAWMRVLAGLIPGLDLVGYKEFHRVGKIECRYHVCSFATRR